MSLEAILAKIEEDAAARAAEIEAKADDQAEGVLAEAREKAEARRGEIRSRGGREAELTAERLADMTELEVRKRRLAVKQRLLDAVVDRAVEDLSALDADGYRRLFAGLVEGSDLEGAYEVITSEAEAGHLSAEFLSGVEGCELTLADERRDLGGGFILRRRRREFNFGFRALIEGLRRRSERELLAALDVGEAPDSPGES